MKKRLECQRRPYSSDTLWPADDNRRNPIRQPLPGQLQPIPGQTIPPMPGQMRTPMQSGMPYPWMQRPMPGQWMPGMDHMSQMRSDMENSGMISSNRSLWNTGRWTTDMWDPDMEDMDERREMEYWQQLFPSQTRRVQREVEHQCDLLDYEGSVMYDEYPDRISLSRICESVYNALMQSGALENSGMMPGNMSNSTSGNTNGNMNGSMSGSVSQNPSSEFQEDTDMSMDDLTAEEEAAGARNYLPIGQVDMLQYDRNGRNDRSLQDLIEVLLFHEMHRRRRRRRRQGRSWYFG